ncbi:MAG: bifunctional phosphoribosylaminoimidazolecarboxamide formyltransferase/IMP cyclohydrolase [Flavobacteriales bacterium]
MPSSDIKIKKALISVFYKDKLLPLAETLYQAGVEIFSTGGTRAFLEQAGFSVIAIEDLTGYPSILGGRVKTLHPKVFGGILKRGQNDQDIEEIERFNIPTFDLVIVDLYPFEETLNKTSDVSEIIEKIDIGGVSLIRAAAKNFTDVLIVPDRKFYNEFTEVFTQNGGKSDETFRRKMAAAAFEITSNYDRMISSWMYGEDNSKALRYGENPHQAASFKGDLSQVFSQLNGKELSYNNLLDVDACLQLLQDFDEASCAIIKHNNACGFASRENQLECWQLALAGDPVSAFGGIIGFNRPLETETAKAIDTIFFEIILAPDFSEEALEILKSKKNRIILKTKPEFQFPEKQIRSLLGGVLEQDSNNYIDQPDTWKVASEVVPNQKQTTDLVFATKLVKHTKSNAIVLASDRQLLASGTGQTSRVDALKQAIEKAKRNNFNLHQAVMASDAFFPFPDCVEIAAAEGIKAIAQPGGSIKDQDSIDACNRLNVGMYLTGKRHFKH